MTLEKATELAQKQANEFGVATICLAYPPMLGFCMGLLACYLLQWLIFKAIGG